MIKINNIAVDTNILLRSYEIGNVSHNTATNSIKILESSGASLYIFPQIIREFWNVSTRPLNRNGLGFDNRTVNLAVQEIMYAFNFLPDHATTFTTWLDMVNQHQVSGVQVHDCYLAATMKAHGIQNLLTFNTSDFLRYGINPVDPADI
jgi:predicted nucleic acid-binding protein